ncbi:hypothetical protein WI27_19230 [Burkholderia cepacia]|nr:hypothetical protein WI27_19230 [Burkholderia cepacia]
MAELRLEQPVEILLVGKTVRPRDFRDALMPALRVAEHVVRVTQPPPRDLPHHAAVFLEQLVEPRSRHADVAADPVGIEVGLQQMHVDVAADPLGQRPVDRAACVVQRLRGRGDGRGEQQQHRLDDARDLVRAQIRQIAEQRQHVVAEQPPDAARQRLPVRLRRMARQQVPGHENRHPFALRHDRLRRADRCEHRPRQTAPVRQRGRRPTSVVEGPSLPAAS